MVSRIPVVNSLFASAIIVVCLLLSGCVTPPNQIPIEQHQALLEEGGTVILVQTHRNLHTPRPPYVTRSAGLIPEIESAAFDLDSLTPNPSGSVSLGSFNPVFDQVLVYTQNIDTIPFFMIPIPSIGHPFPFSRLRAPDAAEFLRQELEAILKPSVPQPSPST